MKTIPRSPRQQSQSGTARVLGYSYLLLGVIAEGLF